MGLAACAQGGFWYGAAVQPGMRLLWEVLWKSSERQHGGCLLCLGAAEKVRQLVTELHCSYASACPCTLLIQTLDTLDFMVWLQTCLIPVNLPGDHRTHGWWCYRHQTCSALLVLGPCLWSYHPAARAVALSSGLTFPMEQPSPVALWQAVCPC